MTEQFCLKWNNYQLSLTTAFKHILEEEDFVDVTLSAGGQSLKGHKVVLSACSTYFRELLKGISPWQHPVLVLRDVPFNDLQSILEFVYLGEVNLEQRRLDSFLKTAEVLQIKGLTDGMKEPPPPNRPPPPLHEVVDCKPDLPNQLHKRPLSAASVFSMEAAVEKKLRMSDSSLRISDSGLRMSDDQDGMVIDVNEYSGEGEYDGEEGSSIYSGDGQSLGEGPGLMLDQGPPPPGVKENLGPLHKRCGVCHMIMLKKNLSRHIRDQHTVERPRSVCPICSKTYKTADWLKDHIRRGHGYTKEDTDDLMSKIKLDNNMNLGDKNILAICDNKNLNVPTIVVPKIELEEKLDQKLAVTQLLG